jgi:hypothetical protein
VEFTLGEKGGDRLLRLVLDDPEGALSLGGRRSVDDLLLDPALVVAEEAGRRADDRPGAPVVDSQRIVGGSGEVGVEADEVVRCGAGVPVDDLVVVPHPEDVERGDGEQPDHQQVERGEVLKFVDQQMATPLLPGTPKLVITQERILVAVEARSQPQLEAPSGEEVESRRLLKR